MKNEVTESHETNVNEILKVESAIDQSLIQTEINSGRETNTTTKEKKYNGFLRNTNRKYKENEKPSLNPQNNKNSQQKTKFTPKNSHKQKQPVEKDLSNSINHIKEDLFSPEHLLFYHLRQKTGTNPNQFWENLYIILKEKEFKDIKRSDMSLISYAALYESIDIFETLLFDYGHLISKEEIEKSIFKISTNKNPLILQNTINFYNKNYTPSEDFINEFFSVIGKSSYREEVNQSLIHWLSPIMTDSNKNNFWNTCFENRNIRLISLALQNYELNHYLRNNQTIFEEHINSSCKKFSILSSLTKKVKPVDIIDTTNHEFIKEVNNKEDEEILASLKKQLPSRSKTSNEESVKKPAKKIIEDNVNDIFSSNSNSKKKLELNSPEITIKKKRKII